MGRSQTNNQRQVSYRLLLSMGVCLTLSHPSFAQNNSFDPFAPQAVAPTEPIAAPTAPAPVAPVIAPRPTPAPVETVTPQPLTTQPVAAPEITSTPSATPTPTPTIAMEPSPAEQKMFKPNKTASPSSQPAEPDSSFFERLANFFDSDEQSEKVESPSEKLVSPPKPAPKPEPVLSAPQEVAPEPIVRAEPVKIDPPTPSQDFEAAQAQLQEIQNQVNAQSIDQPQTPFEAQSLAPTTPVESPKTVEVTQVETPNLTPSEDQPGFFQRLGNFFGSDEEEVERTIIIEAEHQPTPDAVEKYSPRKLEAQAVPDEGGFFSFFTDIFTSNDENEIQKQQLAPEFKPVQPDPVDQIPAQEQAVAPTPIDPRLAAAKLGLGYDILLGQSDNDLSSQARCLTKNRGTVAYCVTPTRWPARIARHFDVSTHLYKGAQGIVQYDGDIATRLYTLFNHEGFDDIVAYYESTYGPATHHFVRKTRTLKKGIVENPTYIWRIEKPQEGLNEIFEIRQVADTRGSIPDLQRGSIRVFFEGSRPIFSLTSDLDYMELK